MQERLAFLWCKFFQTEEVPENCWLISLKCCLCRMARLWTSRKCHSRKQMVLTCVKESFSSVQFSRSVVSDSLLPHGRQLARLPCPSPTLGAYANSSPLSWWCHPTISSSVGPLLLPPSIFPSIRVFSSESVLPIRWPKYWSFSFNISLSNEYSGLISFRMD